MIYEFLTWLNKDSTNLLQSYKNKFNNFCNENNYTECPCIFFGKWDRLPRSRDVRILYDEFEKRALAKGAYRVEASARLQWATLIITSSVISGALLPDVTTTKKLVIICIGIIFGLVVTKIQKHKIVTTRIEAYKYRLYQLYLEKRYTEFLPRLTHTNKYLRGSSAAPAEDRDVSYEKYSLTNLDMLTAFLIQIMYIGLGILLLMITAS
ncbi:MAG: hypothetical protein LRY46_02340 [Candidatus Pacebacteria bacterium]|nr:hypothetical protein [Candidatus Paceibacterota bacterium]MCD8508138.1 hypothetical protein [Candidatus Paceibacterota bacterium]MCD8563774.1 hypothetical protein [Candidatus Paceibacterota bacterium]